MAKPWDLPVTDVLQVYDGDTVRVRLDAGFGTDVRVKIRLVIVDTPERGEAGYYEAGAYVLRWLTDENAEARPGVRCVSYGKTTFDRYLGDLYDETTGETLSGALLREGYARYQR